MIEYQLISAQLGPIIYMKPIEHSGLISKRRPYGHNNSLDLVSEKLGWDWMFPVCFQFLLSFCRYQSIRLLHCHSLDFFHTTETIRSLTLPHSCLLFTNFTPFCNHIRIQYPPITSSPPPLPAMEVVSVMAVGRLPAAGEILINSLFICVERRAPAFWALVLWWR